MQPAPAKIPDSKALERLGGATLEIVHDLKNQLNGLKLYATFLRKRLEREDQPADERETLAKLIAGLDRSAKDLTALVRYARPVELHTKPGVDLQRIVSQAIAEATQRETASLPKMIITVDCQSDDVIGEFDPAAMTEAMKGITDDVRAAKSAKQTESPSVTVRRDPDKDVAIIDWHNAPLPTRSGAPSQGCGTIHTEVARKIIEAHGGELSCDKDTIRISLPLSS
jgi:nitrogen fixation/metabolism regulation signal transduction histidine kinase